jgi:hypothetical protein
MIVLVFNKIVTSVYALNDVCFCSFSSKPPLALISSMVGFGQGYADAFDSASLELEPKFDFLSFISCVVSHH